MKRRSLLRGGSLVLLLGARELAFGATIVAVRLWPAPEYTRLTLESDGLLESRLTSRPGTLTLDIDGIALDPTLRELVAKVKADDPYIGSIRILQHAANTVRLQVELKQPALPQMFHLPPVAAYKNRLVVDFFPPKPVDPLEALIAERMKEKGPVLAPPPAPSDAATIPASLAALRDNGRRLAEARAEGEPTDALERERLRLERAVRSESHTLSATTAEQQKPPSVEEIVAAVGAGCLVELVDVDGTLHVLVAHAGRVRRKVAGSTEEIAALLGPTQMLLRRASRGRATDMSALGGQLQEAILGEAARLIPDGPVVLAPTARLHGLAWPLLPVLGDRPFSVVPSAGQWLRARATPRPTTRNRRTVLVSGPGLATGGAEVPLLAASHPDATLLAGRDATLEQVMHQLDGADLVHLAAHGNFRADSPLFSALDLADGPLTVHDLERVRRAPYRVVLSACESGVLAPVGAEELLGLAAALFSLGTAGLVSSVAEVNDTATADLMVELHAALADGADPATALHRVRREADDPVATGTAAAFLALGV